MNTWKNRYKALETAIGGGYYSLRENISKSGKVYTKLVKTDRSPLLTNIPFAVGA